VECAVKDQVCPARTQKTLYFGEVVSTYPGNIPLQSKQTYSSKTSQQFKYHTQANTSPSKPEFNKNWTKVSYKRGRSAQDEIQTKTKHSKES
jgi:hypothetical protein